VGIFRKTGKKASSNKEDDMIQELQPAPEMDPRAFDKIEKKRTDLPGVRVRPTERAMLRREGLLDDHTGLPSSRRGKTGASLLPAGASPSESAFFLPPKRKGGSGHVPVFLTTEDTSRAQMFAAKSVEKSRRIVWGTMILAAVALTTMVIFIGHSIVLSAKNIRIQAEHDSLMERLSQYPSLEELAYLRVGIAPQDEVHGWLVLRASDGTRTLAPTVAVRLYQRDDITAFLADEAPKLMENMQNDLGLRMCMSLLPEPLLTTLTNQFGAFDIKLPEPGQYVIFSEVSIQHSGKYYVWLLEFNSNDEVNTPIELSPTNAIRSFDPRLMLREAR